MSCTGDVRVAPVFSSFCDVAHDVIRLVGEACVGVFSPKDLANFTASSWSVRLILGDALKTLHDDVETLSCMSKKMRPWGALISTLPRETLLAWRSRYIMLAKESAILSKVIRAGSLQMILHIRMEHARMGDQNLSALMGSLGTKSTPNLCVLSLRGNVIGPSGMKAVSCAMSRGVLDRLRVLDLSENQLRNGGVEAFCSALAAGALRTLRHLNLEHNTIGDAGMKRLSDALSVGAMASPLDIMIGGNLGNTRIVHEVASARSMELHCVAFDRNYLR